MKVVHRWWISMPITGKAYDRETVEFRLLSHYDKAETHFAIERCERDRAGGERWVDVSSWHQEVSLKNATASGNYSGAALLAAALVRLLDDRPVPRGAATARLGPDGTVDWDTP